MTTLDLDRITWPIAKARVEETNDEAEILEYINVDNCQYLYEPISWKIMKHLINGVTITQYNGIISLIDEYQFYELEVTTNGDIGWHYDVMNHWILANVIDSDDY